MSWWDGVLVVSVWRRRPVMLRLLYAESTAVQIVSCCEECFDGDEGRLGMHRMGGSKRACVACSRIIYEYGTAIRIAVVDWSGAEMNLLCASAVVDVHVAL